MLHYSINFLRPFFLYLLITSIRIKELFSSQFKTKSMFSIILDNYSNFLKVLIFIFFKKDELLFNN